MVPDAARALAPQRQRRPGGGPGPRTPSEVENKDVEMEDEAQPLPAGRARRALAGARRRTVTHSPGAGPQRAQGGRWRPRRDSADAGVGELAGGAVAPLPLAARRRQAPTLLVDGSRRRTRTSETVDATEGSPRDPGKTAAALWQDRPTNTEPPTGRPPGRTAAPRGSLNRDVAQKGNQEGTSRIARTPGGSGQSSGKPSGAGAASSSASKR